ncbi:MAG: ABC transporter permease [Bacteroidota bacterium]
MNNRNTIPPPLAKRLLHFFLRDTLAEEVEGDLEEKFYLLLQSTSPRKAKRNYWYQVIHYVRPFAIRRLTSTQLNTIDMLRNYFKIGWRNLSRQKMYSTIKVGGFAIGIAACLLILLFVKNELSYDKHYPDADRIFRVVGVNNENGDMQKGTPFPAPMAAAMKEDYAEVEMTGRYLSSELFGAGNNEVRPGDQQENSYDQGFAYVDQELINMLQLPFVYGNPQRALETPNSIVITESTASKYFPNQNPLGKTLIVDNNVNKPYEITGVIEDFKTTSHLQFNFLMSTKGLEFWNSEQKDWGANNYVVYVKLQQGTNLHDFQKKMSKGIIDKYYLPMLLSSGMSLQDTEKLFAKAWLELQPITQIHLYSADVDGGMHAGDIRIVWIFGGTALFILLIAIFNFVNLSTAKSANRAKEVGLRKVVGSVRRHLVHQFLTESILFSLLSVVLGVILVWLSLPFFNILANRTLTIPWTEVTWFPLLIAGAIFIGLLAGLYPSFYLSAFKPIEVLKGKVAKGSKSSTLRNGLVVFQFTISIVLVVGTLIIQRQMDFILNKKIGFDKEQVLLIEGAQSVGSQMATFKNELKNVPGIQSVTVSEYLPVRGLRNGNSFWHEGRVNEERAIIAQRWQVDHDYVKTLGMHLVEGRDFNESMPSDSGSMIVNQQMAKLLGGDVIGKRISNGGPSWTIIGVVEDFHFESMRENIEGVALVIGNSPAVVAAKVSTQSMPELIASITTTWKKFAPQQPLRYNFLDQRYAAMYEDVQRTGRIFTSFAILAIAVACLGLFALSAFMVEQRAKEISIRLVLGASVNSIFGMLTKNFLLLVLIAFLVATPVAWYLMQKWLQDYAYRIDMTWEVFALAGTMAAFIALATISYQAIKAAMASPVKSLRSE